MASATAFWPLCRAIWVPAAPRLESSVSSPEICWFSLASTPMAGAIGADSRGDRVTAPVELVGQVRDGRQCVVDGDLPAGERADTVVDGAQEGPDRRLVTVEGRVELVDDCLQLVDPTTVEDEGQGAESVLDARSVARRRLGDVRVRTEELAVVPAGHGRQRRGGLQEDVLVAQRIVEADLRRWSRPAGGLTSRCRGSGRLGSPGWRWH